MSLVTSWPVFDPYVVVMRSRSKFSTCVPRISMITKFLKFHDNVFGTQLSSTSASKEYDDGRKAINHRVLC